MTLEPSAPNIDAYSTPITPAPTTVIVRGTRLSSFSRPSESMIVRSSNSTDAGRAGRVPTAITIRFARTGSSEPSMRTVWSSSKAASPGSSPTWLRRNCSRVIAVSAATTAAARSSSCWIAWRSDSSTAARVEHVQRTRGELLQGGLAQGLRRDRPGMDRDAAEAVTALGDGDTLAELGCLDGGVLTAGTRADDEKIELHGVKSP